MDEYNYLVALLEDDGSNSEQCVFMEQLFQSYYHYSIEPYMWETFNLVLYLNSLHRLYINRTGFINVLQSEKKLSS